MVCLFPISCSVSRQKRSGSPPMAAPQFRVPVRRRRQRTAYASRRETRFSRLGAMAGLNPGGPLAETVSFRSACNLLPFHEQEDLPTRRADSAGARRPAPVREFNPPRREFGAPPRQRSRRQKEAAFKCPGLGQEKRGVAAARDMKREIRLRGTGAYWGCSSVRVRPSSEVGVPGVGGVVSSSPSSSTSSSWSSALAPRTSR